MISLTVVRGFEMKRLVSCVALLMMAGCASTVNHSADSKARTPSAVQRPEDKCFSVSSTDVVPSDLYRISYNINPGDQRDQPEKPFHEQFLTFDTISADFCWLAKVVEKRKSNPVVGQSNIAKISITHGARSKAYVRCQADALGIDLRCESSRTGDSENCYVYGLVEGSSCR